MNDYGYLKVLAQLSSNVYSADGSLNIPVSYTIAKKGIIEFSSGFQAVIYEKDGKKVLAIRGTEFEPLDNLIETYKDLIVADIGGLGTDSIPNSQYSDMVKFINDNKELLKGATVVGHSLGGTLAEIAAKSFPKFKVIN